MVNSRHTIGTGRALVKNKGNGTFPEINAFFKRIFPVPNLQYFLFNRRKIQLLKFTILGTHKYYWKSRQMYRKSKDVCTNRRIICLCSPLSDSFEDPPASGTNHLHETIYIENFGGANVLHIIHLSQKITDWRIRINR